MAEGIQASFEDGVLQILVPKAEEAKPKRIQVRPGRTEIYAASSEGASSQDTPPSQTERGAAGGGAPRFTRSPYRPQHRIQRAPAAHP
jgi:hypothetical protein